MTFGTCAGAVPPGRAGAMELRPRRLGIWAWCRVRAVLGAAMVGALMGVMVTAGCSTVPGTGPSEAVVMAEWADVAAAVDWGISEGEVAILTLEETGVPAGLGNPSAALGSLGGPPSPGRVGLVGEHRRYEVLMVEGRQGVLEVWPTGEVGADGRQAIAIRASLGPEYQVREGRIVRAMAERFEELRGENGWKTLRTTPK